jgi:hypothetical protein
MKTRIQRMQKEKRFAAPCGARSEVDGLVRIVVTGCISALATVRNANSERYPWSDPRKLTYFL